MKTKVQMIRRLQAELKDVQFTISPALVGKFNHSETAFASLVELISRAAKNLKEDERRWFTRTDEGEMVPVCPEYHPGGKNRIPTETLNGIKVACIPVVVPNSRMLNFLLFSEITVNKGLTEGHHRL